MYLLLCLNKLLLFLTNTNNVQLLSSQKGRSCDITSLLFYKLKKMYL